MRFLIILSMLVFLGGCLGETPSEETVTVVCNPPYIRMGGDCCLDENQDSICDSDETTTSIKVTTTTVEVQVTTTLQVTTTTIITTSSTSSSTSVESTTSLNPFYNCVKNAGYNPDKFIYVYSGECGNQFVSTAESASTSKGVGLIKLHIGVLSDKEIGVLECFYGEYTPTSAANFGFCPRLLCPKTGEVENVDGRRPVSIQMNSFARDCS
jgi:hypothetical protein